MAKHTLKLPEYVVAVRRKAFTVYYYQVPKRIRPEGWPGAIRLGRIEIEGIQAIISKAKDLKSRMDGEKKGNELGISRTAAPGTLPDIIDKYKSSEYWESTKPETRKGYNRYISIIEAWSKRAGHPHIKSMQTKHVYAFLAQYHDRPRQQQYLKAMFSILFNIAVINGYVDRNLIKEMKLSRRKGGAKITFWTEKDVDALVKKADEMGLPSIGNAVIISYETAQRQTDALSCQQPRDYDSGKFKFQQSKTGATVVLQATEKARARLDPVPRERLLLCPCEATGKRWTVHHFSRRFREVATAAGLPDHLFRHLRHSNIINMERSGCTIPEIASITGHSRDTVKRLLDTAYALDRDEIAAKTAVSKLENYRNISEKV